MWHHLNTTLNRPLPERIKGVIPPRPRDIRSIQRVFIRYHQRTGCRDVVKLHDSVSEGLPMLDTLSTNGTMM